MTSGSNIRSREYYLVKIELLARRIPKKDYICVNMGKCTVMVYDGTIALSSSQYVGESTIYSRFQGDWSATFNRFELHDILVALDREEEQNMIHVSSDHKIKVYSYPVE